MYRNKLHKHNNRIYQFSKLFKTADGLALLSISNRKVKDFKHGVLLIFLLKSFIFCLSKPCICTAVCNVDNNRINVSRNLCLDLAALLKMTGTF